MQLFSFSEKIDLQLPDATIYYYPNFFSTPTSNKYYDALLHNIKWQQDNITLFGKTHKQPRLTALYANNGKPYSYSNIIMHPHNFVKELEDIKHKVELVAKHIFTTCLLNLYRDGNDSNSWHADDEKELGINPIIASISFGEERWFHLKHKTVPSLKHKLILHQKQLYKYQVHATLKWC